MHRAVYLLVLALAVSFVSGRALHSQAGAPDLIVVNANVYTVDHAFSTAQAFAVKDGKFTVVGTNAQIRKLAASATKVLDMGGRTITPGLQDDHLHGAGGGPGVDLSRARSIQGVLNAVSARVKAAGPEDVVVSNSDWHEAQLKEQRLPLRRELDTVAPSTPVVLVRGGHEYILNSAALLKYGITKNTPEMSGGRISRDEKGELNGELVDRAKSLVMLPRNAESALDAQYFINEHRKLNAAGLTGIRYPGASIEQYRILQDMANKHQLTIRVSQLMRPPVQNAQQLKSAIASWGLKPDDGDEWLRVGGIKLAVDGGFEGGWMTELYAKPFDEGGTFRGLNTMTQDVFTDIVKEASREGWRVATHAVGDAAMDEVLAGYEAANEVNSIVGRRWTIEHGFIPRPDHFPRIKKLGLIESAQDHLYLAGSSLVKLWGPKRAARVTPLRSYIDSGIPVAGGTDAPVVPYPPLWVFYHFVTRATISGGVLGPDQKITRQEALKLETINNAYVTFEEKIKGSIEPGKLADFIVLSGDLMTVPAKQIESMSVLMTVVGGKIVYQQDGFKPSASAKAPVP